MKRIVAIFFLVLFAFNWFGYRLMFDYLQQKTNSTLETLLDAHSYADSELIELKIPVHLPYQNTWSKSERCDGEIEINGILYKYVKRQLAYDTLYLMCIPNTKKMHLETAKNDFFKRQNGLMQNKNSNDNDRSNLVNKNPQTVYNESFFLIKLIPSFTRVGTHWLPQKSKDLLFASHISPEQPPDLGLI